jgi:RNA polymerase sigma-70 factor (ECF subfamily)
MNQRAEEIDIVRLVAEHHGGVYGYAFRLSGSTADAEDLAQQVFLIAQRKLGQLRDPQHAKSWLFAILRTCFWKSSQKRRLVSAQSPALNLDTIPEKPPHESAVDREQLQKALNQLSEKSRVVLTMFYFENRSYREIAEQLDLPIGTVMSRLARAKNQLRGRLFGIAEAERAGRPKMRRPAGVEP